MDRPTKDSLRILAEGCRKAGIDALARMDDHLVLSIDRLEEYLAGKREWNAIYTHRGGPHSREWVFGR
ncbi:MAG TPA: hypothetical protein VM328_12555 [Fimbriimonadaceae bacterium]|nr:hypothetical protein [Fimbriimonadaceae bacterium]